MRDFVSSKKVKETFQLPVLSDVHRMGEVERAAQVLDVIQIPAFLCRQTDLIVAVAKTGIPVNIKKGQFISPLEMGPITRKVTAAGNRNLLITERGFSFGYNNLVVDMRSLAIMGKLGFPVVFDATHSVQLPGGAGEPVPADSGSLWAVLQRRRWGRAQTVSLWKSTPIRIALCAMDPIPCPLKP